MKATAKDLLARLPRTFVLALSEKLGKWDLLFPAEQRLLAAQMDWMGGLPAREFNDLFAQIKEIESRMDFAGWVRESAGLNIHNVARLARSPYYQQWRNEVERAFSQIDAAIEPRLPQVPRLVLCVLPAGIAPPSFKPWPELANEGQWLRLSAPFGHMLIDFVAALGHRDLPAGLDEIEGTCAFEYDRNLAESDRLGRLPVLSWSALEAVRRKFLSRLNVIRKELYSADRTNRELQQMDIGKKLPEDLAPPRMREFVRELLLSGNGGLVFGNSFVQWGASETLRRVQPQALVACFGIRNKPKPFSSIVMFEDQTRANPVPDEKDPTGSLIDSELLSRYVHLAAQRLVPYRGRTLTLFATADLDQLLVLSPKEAQPLPSPDSEGIGPAGFKDYVLEWLGSRG